MALGRRGAVAPTDLELHRGEIVGFARAMRRFAAKVEAPEGVVDTCGTGGDAKGQPTQTNSISHGSPWLLVRQIQVGAAFD